ncbi:MAG TPA: 4-hydroxy-tetrahydrodipicolinate synthase [Acidimicrobiales bacterium]|jgi:4-hydroxy-tetrahydrodipicolinate synthase|nr:4-hydroxy-tetrahydrodipicolinate synthase [Acidimicrobiales bacterium]
MSEARFGRLLTAMVTPFDDAGDLDLDAARDLSRWLCAHGSEGLVVAGTTGEGPVLTDSEKLDLFSAVAGAVDVPVIAGTTGNNTAHDVELTAKAAATGVAGVLALCPYYSRPSQAGIAGHLGAIAEATELPVMVYDIPVRTGRRIDPATLLGLARDHRNVVAVKDSTVDLVSAARIVAAAPNGFEVYSGDDALVLPYLSIGAVGLISVAAHWCGTELAQVISLFEKGDHDAAVAQQASLLDSFAFMSTERWPNPLPTKAVLRAIGLRVGQCRLPMGPSDDSLDAAAASIAAGFPALHA